MAERDSDWQAGDEAVTREENEHVRLLRRIKRPTDDGWNWLVRLVTVVKPSDVVEFQVYEGNLLPSSTNTMSAHYCECRNVSRCEIHTHPSKKVQDALNSLMDVMAEFDDETQSTSALLFHSVHPAGVFTTSWSDII